MRAACRSKVQETCPGLVATVTVDNDLRPRKAIGERVRVDRFDGFSGMRLPAASPGASKSASWKGAQEGLRPTDPLRESGLV